MPREFSSCGFISFPTVLTESGKAPIPYQLTSHITSKKTDTALVQCPSNIVLVPLDCLVKPRLVQCPSGHETFWRVTKWLASSCCLCRLPAIVSETYRSRCLRWNDPETVLCEEWYDPNIRDLQGSCTQRGIQVFHSFLSRGIRLWWRGLESYRRYLQIALFLQKISASGSESDQGLRQTRKMEITAGVVQEY